MKKILITLGDAAGVGPEVIVKLLSGPGVSDGIENIVIGEQWILEEAAAGLNMDISFCPEDVPAAGAIKVRSPGLLKQGDFSVGELSDKCGGAAYHYFIHAVECCQSGEAHGIVTAPLNKEAMNRAGHHYIGHTEILEKKTGMTTVMSLVHPKIFVAHVTDHLPLKQALEAITPDRIEEVVTLTWKALAARGMPSPRIALAGINPHAGENGLLGNEEQDILVPAMAALKREGFPTYGPFPADTVFMSALQGKYDAVIAMYHDQGFGPMKTLDLAHGVNCTLGIPFVRTSPDHGTAFDIAGKGIADETSMIEAWKLAVDLIGCVDQ